MMSLLTTQRVIANGLAQLRFAEVWPEIRDRADRDERTIRRLDTPKLFELREILRQIVLEQGRKVVIFSSWRRMVKLAHWATEQILAEEGLRVVAVVLAAAVVRVERDAEPDPTCVAARWRPE